VLQAELRITKLLAALAAANIITETQMVKVRKTCRSDGAVWLSSSC